MLCASSARSLPSGILGDRARRNPFPQAMALAEELGIRPLVAHCHLGRGKLSKSTGKCDEAGITSPPPAWIAASFC